jgi:hypothetical protein
MAGALLLLLLVGFALLSRPMAGALFTGFMAGFAPLYPPYVPG